MRTITANEGDTWESIAIAESVPMTSLLIANGLSPDASNPPPEAGADVAVPDDAPTVSVAPGGAHSLDTSPESCLWVRLDMTPDEASGTDDALRLYSDDGSFDVTVNIADRFTANGDCIDVLFDAVDPSLTYSMDYLVDGGEATILVSSVPFSELNDDPLPDADPPASYDSPGPDSDLGDRTFPSFERRDLPDDAVAQLDAHDASSRNDVSDPSDGTGVPT